MKVFVIGNPDSFWFKYYLETIILPRYSDVSLLLEKGKKCKFLDFYSENKINIVYCDNYNPLIMRIPKIRSLYMNNKKIKSIKEKYDLVILLTCRYLDLKIAHSIKKKNGKVVAIFTGTDILKLKKKQMLRLNNELDKCSAHVFASADNPANKARQLEFVKQQGCTTIPFGLVSLSYIDKYRNSNLESFKKQYSIPDDRTVVCVGYNARPEQQHLEVIKNLALLDDKTKLNICVFLPMTYMRENAYCQRVKEAVEQSGLCYVMFENFMDQEEMAQLWLCCDIFINAQLSDAMSASIIECLHAGVKIINASWLKYSELERINVNLESFSSLEEIPNIVKRYSNYKPDKCSIVQQNGYDTTLSNYKNSWNSALDAIDSENINDNNI